MRKPSRVVLYRVVIRVVKWLDDSQVDTMPLLLGPSQL
jgi:hypothetical protein